jgi:hypothetical protein
LGDDELIGPASDSTWTIDGFNSGLVAGVDFSGIENLTGSADNEDTFLLEGTGSLSGLLEGGAAGFDSLVLTSGVFDTVCQCHSELWQCLSNYNHL